MDPKNIAVAIIGAVIAVMLFSALLVPVIDGAQHSQDKTYSNLNLYSRGNIHEFNEDSDDVTVITVCKVGEHTISINGVSENVSTWQAVIVSDGFTIRFYSNNMQLSTLNETKNVTEVTATISGGVATFSDVLNTSGTEISVEAVPISWAYIFESTGDHGAFITENGVTGYVKKGDVYASNWITTTSEYFSIRGETATVTDSNGTTTTNVNWGGEYQNDGVYKMTFSSTSDDFTFTVDNAGEDYTVHPFIVVLPLSVVGTPDDLSDENSLLGIIPILVIVGIIIGVIGAVFIRRE